MGGVSAQTNLATRGEGASAYASSVENLNYAENGLADVNGHWGSNYGDPTEAEENNKNNAWWYVDLGAEKQFNTIVINFNNEAPKHAYVCLGTSTDNGVTITWNTGHILDLTTVAPANAGENKTYTYQVGNQTARFIKYQGTETGNYGFGFNSFSIYMNNDPLVLTSINASITSNILTGKTANISISPSDQFGGQMTATSVSYASNDVSIATVDANGVVTGVSAGTTTITVTADGKTQDVSVTVQASELPTTAPAAPTGNVYVIYDGTTGTWSDQGWGWGGSQENLTIDGKVCRYGYNLGGMQIPNSLKDYTNYTSLIVDVWSKDAHTLNIFFEGEGTNIAKNLNEGWNKLEIPLTGIDGSKVNYLTFQYSTNPKDGRLVFSNVYYGTANNNPNVPTPTHAAGDVVSIYGSFYTAATTMTKANWTANSGQDEEVQDANNKVMRHLTDVDYMGYEYNTDVDITGKNYLHVDIYPVSNTTQASIDIITGKQGQGAFK